MKDFLRIYLLPVLVPVLILLAVRAFWVTQYAVPAAGADSGQLLPGDRVLVNRAVYRHSAPVEGDLVAFRPLHSDTTRLARCLAVPGDTLWLDAERSLVLLHHTSIAAVPFVVPYEGQCVKVTPRNARLLWHSLPRAASCRLQGDTLITLSGRPLRSVTFRQDCYWMEGSPAFGLVPHGSLVGQAFLVSYSTDPQKSFPASLRTERFFLKTETF